VFFDDLIITHTKGKVLQEDHYYPFGLNISALSSTAPLSNPNTFDTFQGQEKVDDFDIGWIQFKWRNHDPAIGRFFNVDPLAESFYYNSTYAFSENKVTNHIELEGLEAYPALAKFKAQGQAMANRLSNRINKMGSSVRNFFSPPDIKQPVGIINGSESASGNDANEKSPDDVDKVIYRDFDNFSDAKDAFGLSKGFKGGRNFFGTSREKLEEMGATEEAMSQSFKGESKIKIGYSGDEPVSIILGEDTLSIEVKQIYDWSNRPGYVKELVNIYLVETSQVVPDSLKNSKPTHSGKTALKRQIFEDGKDKD
jgi:RHS repeat-associated protein